MSFEGLRTEENINTEDLMSLFQDHHEFEHLAAVLVKDESVFEPNYNENLPAEFLDIPPAKPEVQQLEQHKPQQEEHLGIDMPSQILSSEFSGDHDFEIYINPHHGKKSPWLYSASLNQIFITMGQLFPIDFKCRFPQDGGKLYARATPIYCDTQYKNTLVTRCVMHAQEHDKSNQGCKFSLLDHVIRCQERNAVYGGSKHAGKHLYVRIPLNPPTHGSDTSILNFQFMCKNSCGSDAGMNRRAMEVVFTLENENEQILGRRVLNVRVCSCPKRDKNTAERAYHQRQGGTGEDAEPHGKKRKLEKKTGSEVSTEIMDEGKMRAWQINLPTNTSVTKCVFKAVHMALASEKLINKEVDQKAIQKCIDDVQHLLESQ